ncbi:glycoside hydrolase family 2 protein [Pseudonocardia sp. HH130630-07]|uniref:glycoside hydrolase family 2 protein n=1 Tax=Pseudonocardia sp. HH130630-07 TaxID=1690815 RepID=UPI0008153914|nr:glycoside hydrolase family 2 [Pseudonocardia sp. HH130630-07]ANY07710.1 glycoside hydrolase [Pseudonocardia sp. HH130630-07]
MTGPHGTAGSHGPDTRCTGHPRPQLVRPGRTDLCGEWEFATGEDPGGFGARIVVPYPYEAPLSGVGDTGTHPVVWYRRRFDQPPPGPGRRLHLHFGAVDYHARVWVNGTYLGEHRGGHTPFSFDATDALADDGRQTVVVRAEDRLDVGQPRGKQGWRAEPHGVFYLRTTGIWQPVWCETVPETHVRQLHWTPDVAGASVRCEVTLPAPPPPGAQLRVRLSLAGTELARQTVRLYDTHQELDVSIPALRRELDRSELLWSPERPNLVDAVVEILDDAGGVLDRVGSYLGLRSVAVEDGRFVLNGQPVFLRMALAQGYWPESHLAAPSPDALRREVELAKELGFNGIRIHQKIEDPRLLAWCDRIGMLVWEEMPSAFGFGPHVVERVVEEWLAAVRRDRSHPSIVTWVPMNESWGAWDAAVRADQRHYLDALYHLTKAVDGSRPVISNDGWEHTHSDIWGVHDYAQHGSELRERYAGAESVRRILRDRRPGRRRVVLGDGAAPDPSLPVVLTEFGGLSHAPAAGQRWFGYGTVATAGELEERLRDLFTAILDNPELAGFCYTQLTDTAQERNGLLTERREPKLPTAVVHEMVTRAARAVPTERTDLSRAAMRRRSGTDAH